MIQTRESLWNIFKRKLEDIKQGAEQKGWVSTPAQPPDYSNPFLQSFAQKAQNYSNPFVNQMNQPATTPISAPKGSFQAITESGQRLSQQLQQKVSQPVGTFLTNTAQKEIVYPATKGFLGEPLYKKIIEPKIPAGQEVPEGTIIPALSTMAGKIAAMTTLAKGFGVAASSIPTWQKILIHAPKVARVIQTTAAGLTLDQLQQPLNKTLEERQKIFEIGIPQWLSFGIAGATPVKQVYTWLPAVFTGNYISSKLSGNDNQKAFKDALITSAVMSAFKLLELPRDPLTIAREQAAQILGVDPDAPQAEIKQSYYTLAHQYHPDMPTGDQVKFQQISTAYNLLSTTQPQFQSSVWSEIKDLYKYYQSPEGKGMALQLLREIPAGLSIKPIPTSPEQPPNLPANISDLIGKTNADGFTIQNITPNAEGYNAIIISPKGQQLNRVINSGNIEDMTNQYNPPKPAEKINPLVSKIALLSDKLDATTDETQKAIIQTQIDKLQKQITIPATQPIIPKELEPLAVEARRYKGAEEFVNSLDKPRYKPTSEYFQSKGLSKKTADYATMKANEMPEMGSPRFMDVVNGKFGKERNLSGEITVYRIIPRGEKINVSDFVFTDKKTAIDFQNEVGFSRGQQEIFTQKISGKDLITLDKNRFPNEAIYFPKELENLKTKSQLTDFYTQSTKGIKETQPTPTIAPEAQKGVVEAPKVETRIEPPIPPVSTLSDKELFKNITEQLKGFKEVVPMKELVYSVERARRTGILEDALKNVKTPEDVHSALAKIGGQFAQFDFTPLEKLYSPDVQNRVVKAIIDSPTLSVWDKTHTLLAWEKTLKGILPQPAELDMLSQVIGQDFTNQIKALTPLSSKVGNALMQAYNLPRSFLAGFLDLSAILNQNLLGAYRHPIMTAKALGVAIKAFAGELGNKDTFESIMNTIKLDPDYKTLREDMGIDFTEMGQALETREEGFQAPIVEKIPFGIGKLFKATGRAYSAPLNMMRYWEGKQMLASLQAKGTITPNDLKWGGRLVNDMTGRGDIAFFTRYAPVLRQGLFSGKKLMAALDMFNPYFYTHAPKAVRNELLKVWLSLFAGGLLAYLTARLAGAEDTSQDPPNTDFMKIKVGNRRMNPFGIYQQLAVLTARIIKGYATSSTTGKRITLGEGYKPLTRPQLVARFFEMREHPTLSLILQGLEGQNAIGMPFRWGPEIVERFIPMASSDIAELIRDARENKGSPIDTSLATIFAILGVSTQTYGKTIPIVYEDPTTGKTSTKLVEYPRLGDIVWSKISGQPVSTIDPKDWDYVSSKIQSDSIRKYLNSYQSILQEKVNNGKITQAEADKEYQTVLSPLEYPSIYINGLPQDSPIVKEYNRLLNSNVAVPTLEFDYWDYMPTKDIVDYNKKVDYQRKQALLFAMNHPNYNKVNDAGKSKMLSQAINAVENKTRTLYIISKLQVLPRDQWLKEMGKMKKSGLLTKEIYNSLTGQ